MMGKLVISKLDPSRFILYKFFGKEKNVRWVALRELFEDNGIDY